MLPIVTDVTSQQAQALELLMAGHSPGNIARTLGIHRQTLWRWRSLPTFEAYHHYCREREQQRREELAEQMGELLRLSMVSVARELKLGEDPKMRNPLDTALKILRAYAPTTL